MKQNIIIYVYYIWNKTQVKQIDFSLKDKACWVGAT